VSPASLRVVSLNVWKNDGDFPRRLAGVITFLREVRPDIVCLQECFAAPDLRVDVAQILAEAIGLAGFAAPARKKVRLHRATPVSSSSGLAVLARAAPVLETLRLPDDPRDGERIAQRAAFPDGLSLLNVHLTHLPGEDGARLRAAQIQAALGFAARGDDLLVCGDFNAGDDAPELAALFGRADRDLGPDASLAALSTLRAAPGMRAIDHCILLRAGGRWRISALRHGLDADVDPWPSDHLAVIADLVRDGS
jgi:endonuclease/exonuclease/phosphatase family metal-dependent hydrolase